MPGSHSVGGQCRVRPRHGGRRRVGARTVRLRSPAVATPSLKPRLSVAMIRYVGDRSAPDYVAGLVDEIVRIGDETAASARRSTPGG